MSKETVQSKNDTSPVKRSRKSALPAHTTTLQKYLAEISNNAILSREEEYELAMKYKNDGDFDAARKLVTSNLRFVVRVANEYKNYGFNIMDVIQEGNVGLMQAVKGFDPTKGYRLISYAVWWIRAYIQNYVIKSWSLVKVGTTQSQRKLFYKLRSTKNKIGSPEEGLTSNKYGNIASELGVSDEEVKDMDQRMAAKDLSLDSIISADKESTYLDFLPDENSNQEEIITKSEEEGKVRTEMVEALDILKDRERFIVENRVLSETPLTLEEIGTKYKISRERVRQIENVALKKLKSAFEKKGIRR